MIELEEVNESEVKRLVFGGIPMAKNGTVTIEKMPINKIKLGRNSRLNISDEEIEGLMQSIKEEGLLQPIGVIKNGSGYEICYGNRRFLACSKLGMKNIPVIVHEKHKESDVDIKNLTENVQRRNISLMEIGRYIDLLNQEGLSNGECAVRLGVTKSFVEGALDAFRHVPDEFKGDIEIKVGVGNTAKMTRSTPGKISLKTSRSIISAGKAGLINKAQEKMLFKAAKSSSSFKAANLKSYIRALSIGEENFLETVPNLVPILLKFQITEKHKTELEKKYVNNGAFKSVTQLMYAILKGQKAVQIQIANTR